MYKMEDNWRDIMLYELDVIDAMCTELENRGYAIVEKKKEIRHNGVDIIAKMVTSNTNERFFIEAVGGTSSDKKSKIDSPLCIHKNKKTGVSKYKSLTFN